VLDKSIPCYEFKMQLAAREVPLLPQPNLPTGYGFRHFSGEQDIGNWGRIETAVLEFDTEEAAEDFFSIEFFSKHAAELERRCIFVTAPTGLPVATSMAWFTDGGNAGRLHWVAVHPDYQGKSLGRAVVLQALHLLNALEPGKPVWLSTQTWSHKAVKLYHDLGFIIVKDQQTEKVFPEIIATLHPVLGSAVAESLASSACPSFI